MEFTISFFAILAFIIYYSYFRDEKQVEYQPSVEHFYDKLPRRSKKSLKNLIKNGDASTTAQENKEKRKRTLTSDDTLIIKNVKEIVLTSFKEGKDLLNVQIQHDGRLILTSDVIKLFILGQKN
jgi:TRAP-type mannitol/chloroaromatic compound transport system substrate-binding protein